MELRYCAFAIKLTLSCLRENAIELFCAIKQRGQWKLLEKLYQNIVNNVLVLGRANKMSKCEMISDKKQNKKVANVEQNACLTAKKK